MKDRIRLMELENYQRASEEERERMRICPVRYFDLSGFEKESFKEELRQFIYRRGETLSLGSMSVEVQRFKVLQRFLLETAPALKTLAGQNWLLVELEKWLLKNGYKRMVTHTRRTTGKKEYGKNPVYRYLRLLLTYVEPKVVEEEWKKDVWELDKLEGIVLQENPIVRRRRLYFTAFQNEKIKEEIKSVMKMRLKCAKADTIRDELAAFKRFYHFCERRFPNLTSLTEVNRFILEAYIIYLKTEQPGRKDCTKLLVNLKTVLEEAGRLKEAPQLSELFYWGDIPAKKGVLYKVYSDNELKTINTNLTYMGIARARMMVIHQMLGGRISDTLTLPLNCLKEKDGTPWVRIMSVKGHTYDKPVSKELAALIERCRKETMEKFPQSAYLFPDEKDETRPYSYSKLQYHFCVMVRELDLRDDNGELFGFCTHRFRHTYGQKLTDLFVDDVTIARLLGHSGTGTVRRYRRISDPVMERETKAVREQYEEKIRSIVKGWDDFWPDMMKW